MTDREFLEGWTMLVIQPWGRLYNDDTATARTQKALYVDEFAAADPVAWKNVCKRFASSASRWPTIDDLKSALGSSDGHPEREAAWAYVGSRMNDERLTMVLTDPPMREAWGAALQLRDNPVAARMAFLETYDRVLAETRAKGGPAVWTVVVGEDKYLRAEAVEEAIQRFRIPQRDHAWLLENPQVNLPDIKDPAVAGLIGRLADKMSFPDEAKKQIEKRKKP